MDACVIAASLLATAHKHLLSGIMLLDNISLAVISVEEIANRGARTFHFGDEYPYFFLSFFLSFFTQQPI